MIPLATAPPIDVAAWKKLGLLAFFAAFAAIVLYLVLARRGTFERAARIPLDEDERPGAADAEEGRHD